MNYVGKLADSSPSKVHPGIFCHLVPHVGVENWKACCANFWSNFLRVLPGVTGLKVNGTRRERVMIENREAGEIPSIVEIMEQSTVRGLFLSGICRYLKVKMDR